MNLTKLILPLALVIFFPTCERDTRLTLSDRNPPRFKMSGSGKLAMLRMHGPRVRDVQGEEAFIIWEIVPKEGRFNGTRIEDLSPITYGEVPPGYVQIYPEKGNAPALVEGESYDAFVDTVNANGATAYFTIRGGKVVEKDFRGVEISR